MLWSDHSWSDGVITFGKNLNLDRLRGTYEYVKDRDSVSIFPLLAKRDRRFGVRGEEG